MSASDANLTRLGYYEETAFGETESPAKKLQMLPFIGEGLEAQKKTEVSGEIRSSRGTRDLLMVGKNSAGPINHEFAVGPYNALILATLMGVATTGTFKIRGDVTGNNTFTANADVAATYTTALSGSNNDLVFTAVTAGVEGNDITVRYVNPGTPSAALSVGVIGKAITFNLATDGSSVITTTADDIKAALLGSAAASALVTAVDSGGDDGTGVVTALAATNLAGGDGGAFPTAAQGAKYFRVSGAASANNGVKRVATINGTTLTVPAGAFGTNENNVTVTFFYQYYRNGRTFRSYGIEKQFLGLDTPDYELFRGCVPNTWNVNAGAQTRILHTFEFMGTDKLRATSTYGDGSPTAESTREICTSSANLGNVEFGGTIRGDCSALNMTVNNNLRERPVIGSMVTLPHGTGRCDVTGTMTCYFNSSDLVADFIAHTERSVFLPVTDPSGNVLSLFLPRTKATDAQNLIESIDSDVSIAYEFQALEDLTNGYVIQIDQVDAA